MSGDGITSGPHRRQSVCGGVPVPHSVRASAQGPHGHGGGFSTEGASAAVAGVAQRLAPEPGIGLPPGAQLRAGSHPQVSGSPSRLFIETSYAARVVWPLGYLLLKSWKCSHEHGD